MNFDTLDRVVVIFNVAAMVLIKGLVLSLVIYFDKHTSWSGFAISTLYKIYDLTIKSQSTRSRKRRAIRHGAEILRHL